MSLRCTVCRNPVDEGLNFCPHCRTGFASQLACESCGQPVTRGTASCQRCSREQAREIVVASEVIPPQRTLSTTPVVQASFVAPVPAVVRERYVVKSGGVEAEVRFPARDVEVMNLMGQMVAALHAFAGKLNELSGHGELTRKIIRDARVLAADVQEEFETRRGPLR